MTAPVATYVYCVVAAPAAPPLAQAPRGLESMGAPRALAAGAGLWLVVADAPLERYAAEGIERGLRDVDWVGARAVEHESVVEHCLAHGEVIPMKLFTLFASDARAGADIAGRRARIDEALRAIAGRREWGVRVVRDAGRVSPAALAPPQPTVEPAVESGTAFLARKKARRDASLHAAARARGHADGMFDALAERATDARRRGGEPRDGRLVLDAVFLVRTADTHAFRACVDQHAATLAAAGLEVVLSGPWPAYHFIADMS